MLDLIPGELEKDPIRLSKSYGWFTQYNIFTQSEAACGWAHARLLP